MDVKLRTAYIAYTAMMILGSLVSAHLLCMLHAQCTIWCIFTWSLTVGMLKSALQLLILTNLQLNGDYHLLQMRLPSWHQSGFWVKQHAAGHAACNKAYASVA